MTNQITEIDTKHEGWSTYRLVSVRLADGKTLRREMEDHGSAVGVLPYDPQRRMAILISQFRVPVFFVTGEAYLVEAVAGNDRTCQPPADCARRETLEEAGCASTSWSTSRPPGPCPASPPSAWRSILRLTARTTA